MHDIFDGIEYIYFLKVAMHTRNLQLVKYVNTISDTINDWCYFWNNQWLKIKTPRYRRNGKAFNLNFATKRYFSKVQRQIPFSYPVF